MTMIDIEMDSLILHPSAEASIQETQKDDIYTTIKLFNIDCRRKSKTKINKILEINNLTTLAPTKETWLTKETTSNFRNCVTQRLLDKCIQNSSSGDIEKLFCYAAQSNKEKLAEVLKTCVNLNCTKYSDSALIFALKYGNSEHPDYVSCLKMIVEAGIDVNILDFEGKTAINYIAFLYDSSSIDQLKELAKVVLEEDLYKIEDDKSKNILIRMGFDLSTVKFKEMSDQVKLFYWIAKKQTAKFQNFSELSQFANCSNGENTLLQFAVQKSHDMQPIVRLLLTNGANPNATDQNSVTPLELAALQHYQKIFEELLSHEKTKITEQQFNNFVSYRANSMKPKYLQMILESKKLSFEFTYKPTGNTPLHYAISFGYKKAIQALLQQTSSLLAQNVKGKKIIDVIDASDLETYFDWCLAFENYTPYFRNSDYKMKIRFNSLIDLQSGKEVEVIGNIGKNSNLQHLLTHPLIHMFLSLKWFKIQIYFWMVLGLQTVIYLCLTVFFLCYPKTSKIFFVFGLCISIINAIVKIPCIFLSYSRTCAEVNFSSIRHAAFHSFVELFVIVILIGGFFHKQFQAFVFIGMTLSFLLTAGYHPKLSKWSMMLQKVFKTFTILLIFFSLIIISFSIGFYTLFQDEMFHNMTQAFLTTSIMTTGEFNSRDIKFENVGFGGYLLFLLFVMSVSLVIVNFWIGVAVSDIEKIERRSEINSFKNVIIFMLFIDYINTFNFCKKFLPNSLVFTSTTKNVENYEVDFFPNREMQFKFFDEKESNDNKEKHRIDILSAQETQISKKKPPTAVLDKDCFVKLETMHYKKQQKLNEQNMFVKLEKLGKTMEELKGKLNSTNQTLEELKKNSNLIVKQTKN